MKKITRFLSLIVLLGILMSLCGCSYLDELRATRATIVEDGAIRLVDGTEYYLLPENEHFSPDFTNDAIIYAVEDEDVPLLLIDLFGDHGYKNQDGQFLKMYLTGSTQYYCRADSFDSMLARMNSSFTPELYCYDYYDSEIYEYQLYTLTPQQAEAVESVLADQEPYALPTGAKLDYEYRINLYRYTSDYLFRQKSVDICYKDGTFYLVENGNMIYTVPNSLYVTFSRAVRKHLE